MISIMLHTFIGDDEYIEGRCLSTDTKPTEHIQNGSTLYEMDTKDLYMYDEENNTWRKQ